MRTACQSLPLRPRWAHADHPVSATWHGTWHGGSTHESGTVTYTHTLAIRVWISLVVAPAAVQGNYIRPFDDPLLWAPLAALIGTVGGVVVLVAILVRRRIARPTYPPHS